MYNEQGWSEEVEWMSRLQAQINTLRQRLCELMHEHGCIHCEEDGCPVQRASGGLREDQPGDGSVDVQGIRTTAWWSGPPHL